MEFDEIACIERYYAEAERNLKNFHHKQQSTALSKDENKLDEQQQMLVLNRFR